MGAPSRRAKHPIVEQVEGRELMSGVLALLAGQPQTPHALVATMPTPGVDNGGTGQDGNGFPVVNASPLLGQGQQTPHELARERFHASFQGPFTVGPGRFSDQLKTIYVRGLGGSNKFRHGDFQMAIVFPKDPNAPLIGEALLEDKSINSGGLIGLDLTGDRNAVDRLGRPNHLTFIGNSNIYSGIFFNNTSSGTVDIHYSKGSATVSFDGRVYTMGLASPLKNGDLYARGGRITPRT